MTVSRESGERKFGRLLTTKTDAVQLNRESHRLIFVVSNKYSHWLDNFHHQYM
jgi:hypothetical protein